jgi:hypothetical protein
LPSLLERIVDKARLIADMMGKMQNKIKDSNLRKINPSSITSFDDLKVQKGKKTHSVVDHEEVKSFAGARPRKYSEMK